MQQNSNVFLSFILSHSTIEDLQPYIFVHSIELSHIITPEELRSIAACIFPAEHLGVTHQRSQSLHV